MSMSSMDLQHNKSSMDLEHSKSSTDWKRASLPWIWNTINLPWICNTASIPWICNRASLPWTCNRASLPHSHEGSTQGTPTAQGISTPRSPCSSSVQGGSCGRHSPRRDLRAMLREAKRPISRETSSCKSKPQDTATSGRP